MISLRVAEQDLRAGKMTNLDSAYRQTEFEIDCIEFVDQFFRTKPRTRGICGS